jgi:4-aminobutyrate aminotransferase-like enzyme
MTFPKALIFISYVDRFYSIRFAPPLVISEEDLMKAVRIIGECLEDLDTVRSWASI